MAGIPPPPPLPQGTVVPQARVAPPPMPANRASGMVGGGLGKQATAAVPGGIPAASLMPRGVGYAAAPALPPAAPLGVGGFAPPPPPPLPPGTVIPQSRPLPPAMPPVKVQSRLQLPPGAVPTAIHPAVARKVLERPANG